MWPTRRGRRLGFLACIDLAELPCEHDLDWLSRSGRLLFFWDTADDAPWGNDPSERDGWFVAYVPASVVITSEDHVPSGLPPKHRVIRRGIEFILTSLPPSPQHQAVDALHLTDLEERDLLSWRGDLYGEFGHHQIGGCPDVLQNDDMEVICQLASDGTTIDGSLSYDRQRELAMGRGAAEWQLLLQLDSDDEFFSWWSDGVLCFWIRREDALRCQFDRAWMVFQCT